MLDDNKLTELFGLANNPMDFVVSKAKEAGYNPDEIEIVIMDESTGTIMEIKPVANS